MKLFAPALAGLELVALAVASPTPSDANTDVAASWYNNNNSNNNNGKLM
jgi:hypothetical protein